ncbi:MAG: hypothetical protein JWQ72_1070 [Polaromonas sp.]|nr:hypothetical protein [Polaromonas sp.]
MAAGKAHLSHDYRIENRDPVSDSLLPSPAPGKLYADPSLAVAVAVKSVTDPSVQAVRVVHVPTGEVVFDTAARARRTG